MMDTVLGSSDHLERGLTPEPVFGPATGSLLLHLGLVGTILFYGILGGFFHHTQWGGDAGGAVNVNLVSDALPLPSVQPPNQNILATDKPSQAPAPPAPVEKHVQEPDAIPIQGKTQKVDQKPTPKSPPKQQQPVPTTKPTYGEQPEAAMARSAPSITAGPAQVSDSSFGALFPWYVQQIARKMDANGYRSLADPRTPRGARAYIEFAISRDGSHGEVKLDRSSGSPTWDTACQNAARRIDTFGALPPQYRGNTLSVSFYCEY
jgi:periplasmic protein TonB